MPHWQAQDRLVLIAHRKIAVRVATILRRVKAVRLDLEILAALIGLCHRARPDQIQSMALCLIKRGARRQSHQNGIDNNTSPPNSWK